MTDDSRSGAAKGSKIRRPATTPEYRDILAKVERHKFAAEQAQRRLDTARTISRDPDFREYMGVTVEAAAQAIGRFEYEAEAYRRAYELVREDVLAWYGEHAVAPAATG